MQTYGIGGSTIEEELNKISPKSQFVSPIQKEEYLSRIKKVVGLMRTNHVPALYVNAGTNLTYFTGTTWSPSERMVGALIFLDGSVHYIAPKFEKGTILDFMVVEGEVHCWEEHENPYHLFTTVLTLKNINNGEIYVDETTPFFITNGILEITTSYRLINARAIVEPCRMQKSKAEIAIMQLAMDITLEVHKAAARIMRVGITQKEVVDFIHEAHKRYGIVSGSYFCIVLFGADTSFPHGVRSPKPLEANDIILVDTGCVLEGYISDITRTYTFANPTKEQIKIWNIEKEAQLAAFNSAQLGNTCGAVDKAAREIISSYGLGPNYELPGLPHRTGHGIGLDIHEYPYIVKDNNEVLKSGMCFSNEPMICVPNGFGIRLEDHIYMTEEGPQWFTGPAHTINNPFGI
ncbi:Xaa-Pro peptidase family protein [Aestuariivivens sp. NBU2969]|uniref:M24 family metallopeptidase n=1 Tax=Aestuariivivens sp. NBU2969 TaxID=2873267 RepID=UPI001CBF7FFC|nr:Xaa-Pro peptidase family protein [Aestuariivivens sp. NBU2969]